MTQVYTAVHLKIVKILGFPKGQNHNFEQILHVRIAYLVKKRTPYQNNGTTVKIYGAFTVMHGDAFCSDLF